MLMIPANLAEVLAARDKRAAKQKELLNTYGSTVISLTVVAPGRFKRTPDTLFVAQTADELIEHAFAGTILFRELTDSPAGYEAIYVTSLGSRHAKEVSVDIEDTHPLGRLMDIDIIDPNGSAVSRTGDGSAPRRCLLCSHTAAHCIRAKTHTDAEICAAVSELIHSFRAHLD